MALFSKTGEHHLHQVHVHTYTKYWASEYNFILSSSLEFTRTSINPAGFDNAVPTVTSLVGDDSKKERVVSKSKNPLEQKTKTMRRRFFLFYLTATRNFNFEKWFWRCKREREFFFLFDFGNRERRRFQLFLVVPKNKGNWYRDFSQYDKLRWAFWMLSTRQSCFLGGGGE